MRWCATRGGAPHAVLLDSHPLRAFGAAGVAGDMNVKVLVGSGSGVTVLSESSYPQLLRQGPMEEVTRLSTDSMDAVGTEGRLLDLELQTLRLHLALASKGSDGRRDMHIPRL